jgi:hypothetical protein
MPNPQRVSIRLCGRRFFMCPYCQRVAEHPPIFRENMLIGHAYCDHCGNWSRVEDYKPFASEREAGEAGLGRRK